MCGVVWCVKPLRILSTNVYSQTVYMSSLKVITIKQKRLRKGQFKFINANIESFFLSYKTRNALERAISESAFISNRN